MFDHPIIDVALGLIFFYVILSLVASAIQEWIASLCKLRSRNLRAGIKNLIGEKYAKEVYDHPLIKNSAKPNKLPSYIAPGTISTVLLRVIAQENGEKSFAARTAVKARELTGKITEDNPLKEVLDALIDNSEERAITLHSSLAGWFDEGMDRVVGWYKRQVKVLIFIIAGLVTIGTNSSTIHIGEELWRNDALRASIAAQAQIAAAGQNTAVLEEKTLQALEAFPIGWDRRPEDMGGWLKLIVGWLLTIAAVSLGAPFWFDLLGKVANLRGSGDRPRTPKRA